MNTYKSLTLKNVVFYKEATIDLDYKGTTVISGLNKDAGNSKRQRSNGAGKSLFWAALANIRFNSVPNPGDNKTKAKKDLFDKDTVITLEVERDDKVFAIEKKSKGKSIEYDFRMDGKSAKTRTQSYVENKIHHLFGKASEAEFYATEYIDSRKPNMLQMGTPTQRLAFFTNLFNLDSYDNLRGVLTAKYKELKDQKIVQSEIESQLHALKSSIREGLEGQKLSELKAEVTLLEADFKQINEEHSKLNGKSNLLSSVANNIPDLEKWLTLAGKITKNPVTLADVTPQYILDTKALIGKMLKRLKEFKEEAEEYNDYQADLKSIRKQRKVLEGKLEAIKVKGNVADLEDTLSNLKAERQSIKSNLEEVPDVEMSKEDYNKYPDLVLKFGEFKKDHVKKIDEKRSSLKAKVNQLQESLEHLNKNSGSASCPTCLTELGTKKLGSIVSGIKVILDESRTKLHKMVKYENDFTTYLKLSEKMDTYKGAKKSKEKLGADLENVNTAIDRFVSTSGINELKKKESLSRQLRELKAPSKVKEPKMTLEDIAAKESKLKLAQSKCDIYLPMAKSINTIVTKYGVNSLTSLDKSLDSMKETSGRLSKKLEKLNLTLPRKKASLTVVEKDIINHKLAKERLESVQKKLTDLPIYEALIEAYSNKGLKVLAAQRIASMIEQNMNLYSSLLYTERMKFEIIVSKNQFDIKVTRKFGKKIVTSDVRSLSGAESRAFSFLLPLALLPLIPSSRRTNMMILDEPTENMDEGMRDLFLTSFLPKLNTIIPHIVVISPLTLDVPNARYFTAVREKGVTTLQKGKAK